MGHLVRFERFPFPDATLTAKIFLSNRFDVVHKLFYAYSQLTSTPRKKKCFSGCTRLHPKYKLFPCTAQGARNITHSAFLSLAFPQYSTDINVSYCYHLCTLLNHL